MATDFNALKSFIYCLISNEMPYNEVKNIINISTELYITHGPLEQLAAELANNFDEDVIEKTRKEIRCEKELGGQLPALACKLEEISKKDVKPVIQTSELATQFIREGVDNGTYTKEQAAELEKEISQIVFSIK